MPPYELGRLNGKWTVFWYETVDGKKRRHRFRLKAKNKNDAWVEAGRRYNAFLAMKGDTITFEEVWKRYEAYLEGRRTAGQLADTWKPVGPVLGTYHPLEIDDDAIDRYVRIRRDQFRTKKNAEISQGTLYNEIGLIQSALNFAAKKKLIRESPHKLKRPPKPAPKDRWLDDDEIRRFLAATRSTPHLHVAVVLMLSTAGRKGAVLELTWDRIDFEARTIDLRTVRDPYAKKRAFVPMNSGTYALLSQWKPRCVSEYVVEYQQKGMKDIKKSFEAAAKRAGLEDVTPHVWRHTAAVHMVKNGCSMARVSQYLGHSSLLVTEGTYARFAPGHLKQEAEAVDFLDAKDAVLGES